MEITWWGTAGFRIKTGKKVVLLDPYLSRNPDAKPRQYLKPEEIQQVSSYILSLQGTDPPNAKAPEGELYEL